MAPNINNTKNGSNKSNTPCHTLYTTDSGLKNCKKTYFYPFPFQAIAPQVTGWRSS